MIATERRELRQEDFSKYRFLIEELPLIPASWFVEELDLTEEDRREISKPLKEGWQISLIDCLRIDERKKLDEALRKPVFSYVDMGHFNDNQLPWILRYAFLKGIHPNSAGAINAYASENSDRYRISYFLAYPEMENVIPEQARTITEKELSMLETFFSKAGQISLENYNRQGSKGLIDYQRVKIAIAKRNREMDILQDSYLNLLVNPIKVAIEQGS